MIAEKVGQTYRNNHLEDYQEHHTIFKNARSIAFLPRTFGE